MKKISLLPLLLCGVATAIAVTGCGGSSSNGSQLAPVSSAGPLVEGLSPLGALAKQNFVELSGFGSPSDGTVAYATGGTGYTFTGNPSLYGPNPPLGFAPGSTFSNGFSGQALAPGASVVFRAAIATGVSGSNNSTIDLVPTSVKLSSSEISGFSEGLTFNSPVNGALPNGTYSTGSFTLPFTTTGIHSVTVSAEDTADNTTSTTFGAVVLAPSDSAALVEVVGSSGPLQGVGVKIDNPLSNVTAYGATSTASTVSVTDSNGVAIVFASPGSHTLSIASGATGSPVPVTLTAGQLLANVSGTPLTIQATASTNARRVRK